MADIFYRNITQDGNWVHVPNATSPYVIENVNEDEFAVGVTIPVKTELAGEVVVEPTAPAQITAPMWSLADAEDPEGDKLTVTLTAEFLGLDDGGSALTAVQWQARVGAGEWSEWTSLGGTTPGNYTITGTPDELNDVRLRAVNAVGEGDPGDVKQATPTDGEEPATAPAAFTIGMWSLTDAETGGTLDVTINAMPDDGGAEITDIEYRVDSGSWESSGGVVSFQITGLTDDEQVDMQIRAVNSVGESDPSDVKQGTPTSGEVPEPAPFEEIETGGWTAIAADPVAALDQTFAVTRQGHDAAGEATTVTDTLTVTARLRLPYPDQATLTTEQVVLSDFVYVGDTIAGAANNSTRPAPLPIAEWLGYDQEIVSAGTYTARLAVAHAHARGGRPVAAVKFIATDGVDTVEQVVTSMASTTYAVSGLTVPHFEAALDLTGFTNGVTLTVDAVIYPWVGQPFQLSVDADPYPSANLTTRRIHLDRTGAYGRAYAYVDADTGTAEGVASTDPQTAAAAPFETVVQAVAAIRAYHNTNSARDSAGGGIIRLVEGVHVLTATIQSSAAMPVGSWPLTIEAADPAKRSTTILTDRGTTMQNGVPRYTLYRDITIQRSGPGNIALLDASAPNKDYDYSMSFDRVVFDNNGAGIYNTWIYRTGNCTFVECSDGGVDSGQAAINASSVNKAVKAFGCVGSFFNINSTFGALGSKGRGTAQVGLVETAARVKPAGQFFGWNHILAPAGVGTAASLTDATGLRGAALVGNVFERGDSSVSPLVLLSADNNVQPQENVLMQSNSAVGQRTNWLYQDIGTETVHKSGYRFGNVDTKINTKSDVFGNSGNLIGNWPIIYQVSAGYNCKLLGASDTKSYGPGSWIGELAAPGDVHGSDDVPVVADWADDRSVLGAGGGWGDYTPGPASALPRIPAGLAPYPVDLLGRPVPNDGTGVVGAQQRAVP